METNMTCGPLFLRARNIFSNTYTTEFEAGFCVGLCEKVHLGAAQAAMMRPEKEHFDWTLRIVNDIVRVYSLLVEIYEYKDGTRDKSEIWILRDSESKIQLNLLRMHGVNSPEWHRIRGRLCGVPEKELDTNFHMRIMGAT